MYASWKTIQLFFINVNLTPTVGCEVLRSGVGETKDWNNNIKVELGAGQPGKTTRRN